MSSSRPISPAGSSSPACLTALPNEVLEHVFTLLAIPDRLRVNRVCKLLREVYTGSAPLQYDFHLVTSGNLDVPYFPPPIAQSRNARSRARSLSRSRSRSPSPTSPSPALYPLLSYRDRQHAQARADFPSESRSAPLARRNGPLPVQEKARLLAEQERRWETMDFAEMRKFTIRGPAGVYELQEGMFLICDEYTELDDRKPTSIRLIPLPSSADPDLLDPPIPLKSNKLPFQIADLTMDPTQDLIVVSEHRPAPANPTLPAPTHRFHLLSMSTFKPHPLASTPTLDFPPFTQDIMQTRQLLQVMGDTLVILVSRFASHWILAGMGIAMAGMAAAGNEEELVAWNWKTGAVLGRLALPENGWFSSFALLTPTTFMVTSTSNVSPFMPSEPRSIAAVFPPVIQIYSLLPDPEHTIVPVQPLDADFMDDTTLRPAMVAQMELPRFAPGVVISAFDVRPDPAFPPLPKGYDGPSLVRDKAFTQNPEKGVLVFDLQIVEPRDPALSPAQHDGLDTTSYELFVLRETLVDLAREGEDRLKRMRKQGSDDGFGSWRAERNLPWSEWGEYGSRLMDVSMRRRTWVCSCSGYRFVSVVPIPMFTEPEEPQHELVHLAPVRSDIRLLDFSPLYARKEGLKSQSEADGSGDGDGGGGGDDDDDDADSIFGHIEPIIDPSSGERRGYRRVPPMFRPGQWKGVSTRIVDAPTILPKRRIWRDDVVTSLPFREVTRRMAIRANGVMIDDQRVIVVCTEGRRNGDWTNIRQELTVLCMGAGKSDSE